MFRQRSSQPGWLRALLLAASFGVGFLARGRTRGDRAPAMVAAPVPELVAEVAPQAEVPTPLADLPPPEPRVQPPPPPFDAFRPPAAVEPPTRSALRLPSPRSALGGAMLFFAAVAVSLLAAALLSGSPSASQGKPRAERGGGHAVRHFSSSQLQSTGRPRGSSVVARARHDGLPIYRKAHGRRPSMRLSRRIVSGKHIPLVFLVEGRRGDWLHVRLPVRPNGSHGWVRRRDVRLALTKYRVVINVKRHRLTLFRLGRAIDHERIATGGAVTPTPNGRYFITDLLRPPDPNGLYGPYAFGTSAFSSVLTNFAGGVGQIGLHGTDTPAVLGTDVSHGCIRVRNSTIRRFAKRLPLGTPVRIEGGAKPGALAPPPAPPPPATKGYTQPGRSVTPSP